MKKKKRSNTVFSRLIGDSRIWSRFFSGKDLSGTQGEEALLKEDKLLKESLLGSLFSDISRLFVRLRLFCATRAEESRILSFFSGLFAKIFDTSVGSIGVFLFFVGIYSAVITFFNLYVRNSASYFPFYYSAALAVTGLVLMPTRRSLLSVIRQGVITSHIAEDLLGISPFALDRESIGRNRVGKAVLGATAVGALGFFISPLYILLFFLLAALLALILYSPEGGLLLAAVTLPFAPVYIPCAFAVTAGVSYLFKLLLGKRNFYISVADIFVFLFGILTLISGVLTPFAFDNIGVLFVTAAFLYILCSNLCRSSEQTAKLCGAFNSGGLIVALCCILARFIPENSGVFGEMINYAAHREGVLLLLLPCCLATAFLRGVFSSGAITTVAVYAALALTFSENNYLLAVVITVGFLVCAYRKRAGIILGGAVTVSAILVLFSLGLIKGEMAAVNFGDISQASTALRYLFTGAGIGESAFTFAFRSAGFADAGQTNLYGALVIAGGAGFLIMFVLSAILLLRRGVSTLRGKTPKEFRFPAAAAVSTLCALLVAGVMGGLWNQYSHILILPIMCGVLCGLPRVYEREVENEYESY